MRQDFLPFSLPTIGEEEIAEVADSLRSGWVTTGPKTRRFEEAFREYVGSKHAIAVNSCTAGLHIALTALGIGSGDEVIVPTLTFCSTANVVVHLGARPVLVDVGEDFNVTPEAIEQAITPKTKAIVPVHYGGQPCDLEAIYAIAARHHLPVVEDAAHAVSATYHGHRIGSDSLSEGAEEQGSLLTQGDKGTRGQGDKEQLDSLPLSPPHLVSPSPPHLVTPSPLHPGTSAPLHRRGVRVITCFSFYATKNMTTGEGGMITTADDELAEQMRLLTLHGMSRDAWKRYTSAGSWYYEVILPGYKDNMTDIQAALGIHQLRKLDGFIAARQRYARLYDQAFADQPELETPITHPDRSHIYHLYVIRLNLERLTIDRTQFIEELKALNIGTSVHFIPVHLHPFYRETFGYRPGDCPVAERLYEQIISLPLFPRMSDQDVEDVIEAVCDVVKRYRK